MVELLLSGSGFGVLHAGCIVAIVVLRDYADGVWRSAVDYASSTAGLLHQRDSVHDRVAQLSRNSGEF